MSSYISWTLKQLLLQADSFPYAKAIGAVARSFSFKLKTPVKQLILLILLINSEEPAVVWRIAAVASLFFLLPSSEELTDRLRNPQEL